MADLSLKPIFRRLDTAWRSSMLGYVLLIISALFAVFWCFYTPPSNYSLIAMAVVAGLMALRPDMRGLERSLWAVVLIVFAHIEISSIKHDTAVRDAAQAHTLTEERQNFNTIGEGIKEAIRQSDSQFTQTMSGISSGQRSNMQQFGTVLTKQTRLFEHQQQVMESLHEQLVPANDPLPSSVLSSCRDMIKANDVIILIDTNAFVSSSLPRTVVRLVDNNDATVAEPIIMRRTPNGTLALIMDIRSQDNRIIARLDDSGIVVNQNNILQIKKPDPHTILLEDEEGKPVLSLRFMNPRAFKLSMNQLNCLLRKT